MVQSQLKLTREIWFSRISGRTRPFAAAGGKWKLTLTMEDRRSEAVSRD